MRSCGEYEALVSAFLDGEVTEAERAELAEHLTGCPACQQYFDDLVAIHDAFDREEAQVPADFAAAVMERVRAAPQVGEEKVLGFPRWRQWAALAACCTLAAVGLWSFGLRGGNTKAARSAQAGNPPVAAQAMLPDMPAADEAETAGGNGINTMSKKEASYMTDADDAAAEPTRERTAVSDEAPAPTPALTASASKEAEETASSLSGTLAVGGETARLWVEEELGLPWEIGRIYPLTEEEYAELLAVLTEAGEDFRQEAGETCLLAEPVE